MNNSRTQTLSGISVAVALVALVLSLGVWIRTPSPSSDGPFRPTLSMLDRLDKEGTLHAGYGVYPPFTQDDPNTKAVSGFSVDVIEQIGKELKCKVVWHRLNWNTMAADLKRGEYDVIADPIFQTVPRAREFAFTAPYAYFPDGIAVVRTADTRFTSFDSLDQGDITIAVGQGWASETLVKTRFSKARINSVQTATDLLQVFNEVIGGRADVAVADGADATRFAAEHTNEVKVLFLDNPPAFMPAGFALRLQDINSAEFLTVCLRNLEATGVLEALARKHGVKTLAKGKQ